MLKHSAGARSWPTHGVVPPSFSKRTFITILKQLSKRNFLALISWISNIVRENSTYSWMKSQTLVTFDHLFKSTQLRHWNLLHYDLLSFTSRKINKNRLSPTILIYPLTTHQSESWSYQPPGILKQSERKPLSGKVYL